LGPLIFDWISRSGRFGWNSIKRHDASKPAPALRRAIRIREQECGNRPRINHAPEEAGCGNALILSWKQAQ
jgi:hypothetical protein